MSAFRLSWRKSPSGRHRVYPGVCRKLTLAESPVALKISYQRLPRTHAGGQVLTFTKVR